MEHGQVVFRLFSPAGKQVAEAIELRMRALHDPAPGSLTRFFSLRFFAAGPGVGSIAKLGYYLTYLGVVIARVQAHMLVVAARPVGVAGGFGRRWHTRQRAFGQFHVIPFTYAQQICAIC